MKGYLKIGIESVTKLVVALLFILSTGCDNDLSNANKVQEIISINQIQRDANNLLVQLKEVEADRFLKWGPSIFNMHDFENIDHKLLYAYYYSTQPKVGEHSVYIIYSQADDWSKCHLITTTQNDVLIDKIEVAKLYDYFYEDSLAYVEVSGAVETTMRSDSVYQIHDADKMIFVFQSGKDSVAINEKIKQIQISKTGKIIEIKNTENKG